MKLRSTGSQPGPRPRPDTVIKPEEIRALLRARPFRPFRICVSDGSACDITNHGMAIVERTTVDIGLDPDPDGIVERLARCAIMRIVKLEDLAQPA